MSILKLGAVCDCDFINDARCSGDDVEIEFSLQTLKDDFEVEQPKEAAAEAKAERHAALLLHMQGGIVELQFDKGIAQHFKIGRVDGINTRIDDGRIFRNPGRGSVTGLRAEVTVSPILTSEVIFDVRKEIAYFARAKDFDRSFFRRKDADFENFKCLIERHHFDLRFLTDLAAHDSDIDHDAAIRVVMGIEDKRADGVVSWGLWDGGQ